MLVAESKKACRSSTERPSVSWQSGCSVEMRSVYKIGLKSLCAGCGAGQGVRTRSLDGAGSGTAWLSIYRTLWINGERATSSISYCRGQIASSLVDEIVVDHVELVGKGDIAKEHRSSSGRSRSPCHSQARSTSACEDPILPKHGLHQVWSRGTESR